MPLTFENPSFLWLVLLAVPFAVLGWRWFTSMSRWRRASAVVLRSTLIALIAVMLAGASSVRTSEEMAVIIIADVSESVERFAKLGVDEATGRELASSEAMARWIRSATGGRGADDLVAVVAFDGQSVAVRSPTSGELEDLRLDLTVAEGTDIAGAIELAEAMVPPGAARRFVLMTDGNETSGDALATAREMVARAGGTPTPIDVVPIEYEVRGEVMIEAVDLPPQASAGATVALRVVLVSTEETSGTLELLYEGDAVDINGPARGTGRRVALKPGRNVIVVPVTLGERTVHRFEPIFVPDEDTADTLRENNRAETFTVTPGDGAVLLVTGINAPSGSSSALKGVLRRAGVNVREVNPGEVGPDLLSLQPYGLIVLNNVPSEEMPRPMHGLLADYVTDLGGGLVMVGGEDSFGAGGWHGTDLEPVLPVRLDLPEQIIRPSAAVMIVLDSSGSMGRPVAGTMRTKQEIANEGAALAIETLDTTDLVGVMSFDSMHRDVVPLGRNSDPEASAKRVRGIFPNGGTNMYPALRAAMDKLNAVEADVKHVILLSDGRSQGDPSSGVETARAIASLGMSVSTIAVGDGADDETLARIAASGGGQFYDVVNPAILPRIFLREVRVVRKPLIREGRFTPQRVSTGNALAGALPEGMPPLFGLVLTQPRDDPKVSNVLTTSEGEPVLASWFVGRGQAVAFTSDASRWAREWIGWPGFESMWTTIARTVARPPTESSSELITQVTGDTLEITYEALTREGEPMGALNVSGTVYAPDGTRTEVRLRQSGPGLYTASVPAKNKGNYVVALAPSQRDRRLPPVIGGTSRAAGPEFMSLRSNTQKVRAIAEATGGRVLSFDDPTGAELFDRSNVEPGEAHQPLWETLLLWTLGVFLLDVATRRVAWDRLLNRELMAEIRRSSGAEASRRSASAASTLGALRAKSRPKQEATAPDETAKRAPMRTKLDRNRGEPRARETGTTEKPPEEANPKDPAPGSTSSLLDAKRRARARYLGRDEDVESDVDDGGESEGDGEDH